MRRASSISLLVAGIWLASSGGALCAAVVDWINPAGGTFSDGANWQGGNAPGPDDTAWFDNSATYTVEFSTAANVIGFYVPTDQVTLDLNKNTLQLPKNSSLLVGYLPGDNASLTVYDGLVDKGGNDDAAFGYLSGSRGSLTVGQGGTFNSFGDVVIGTSGEGELSVIDGGSLGTKNNVILGYNAKSLGSAVVTGTGSLITSPGFEVGFYGEGTLKILAGGKIATSGFARLGSIGSGKALVSGAGSVWEPIILTLADTGIAELTIEQGGRVKASAIDLASEVGGTATAELKGTGSTLDSAFLNIGRAGQGSFVVTDGGAMNTRGVSLGWESKAEGTLELHGIGTTWVSTISDIYVGVEGHGSLTIDQGAVASGPNVVVGADAGGAGNVLVSDVNSQWSTGQIIVGDAGTGQLKVVKLATVNSNSGILGNGVDSSGEAIVTGAGSRWNLLGQLLVGNGGSGELTVSDGATVANTKASPVAWIIGSSASGSVTVEDAGSKMSLLVPLHVGLNGTGSLTVKNGGTVSDTTLTIGRFEGAIGTVDVQGSGSSWTHASTLFIGGDQAGAGGSGELSISNAGLVKVGTTTTVWETGAVHLDAGTLQATTVNLSGGSLGGIGTVIGNLNNSGEVSPGNSPGTLKVQGNFSQSLDGLLKLEIGATAADLLQVTGNATLGGTLHLSLLGGFTPSYGTTYDLLTASKLSGAFDTLELPDLGPGRAWQFNYGADRFTITAVPEPSTLVLALLGLVGMLLVGMRRREFACRQRWAGNVAIRAVVSIVACWLVVPTSRAAVIDWNNPAGGTFSDGANWQGGKAPTAADQAVFKLTGPLTTTLNASASARRVVVTQGNTTIDLGGHELVVQSDAEFDDNLEVFTSATLTLKNGAFTNLGGLNNGSNNRGTLNVTANGLLKETNAFWSSGALNVTSGGVIEAYDIEIRAGSGSTVAIVDGAGSVLRGFYVVGDDSDLTVRNSGSIDATVLSLGRTDPTKAHANLTVTGDGSSATASLALQVGYFGSAALTIEKQGFVHSAKTEIGSFENAIGTVTVRDPGSSWIDDGTLWIGADGQGAVAIENGATASAATAFIGDNEGSSGEVSITGSGSKWTVTNLSLKRGELSITNQGGMQTVAGNIGIDSDIHSTVVVDGTGSTWTNSSVMSVGYDGSGSLMISNGGQVVVGSVVVASQVGLLQGSTGDVVVTDAGSQWKLSSPLTIGALGNGSLKIHNGGAVSNTTASIAALEGSKGHVGVSGIGSTWTTSKNMTIGGAASGFGGTGSLEIAYGGLVKVTGTTTVWETGAVHLDAGTLQATTVNLSGGSLDGIGTVIGNLNNSGEVSPGNSPGTLKVQGNFSQSLDGLLKLEIGATAADLLQVTGNSTLGGTLRLSLLGGFTPSYGTTYDLLTASKLSGAFDTLELPDLGPGRAWQFNYGADRFSVTAVPEPSTIVLAALGAMACAAVARRRRTKAS